MNRTQLARCGLGWILMTATALWAQGALPTPLPDLPRTNASVEAMEADGGMLYFGGSFTEVGFGPSGMAVVDGAAGALAGAPLSLNGFVSASAPDGGGGLFIAGTFTAINGQTRGGLAHIFADGSLDPAWLPTVQPGMTAGLVPPIVSMASFGTTLVIGGTFSAVNGVARQCLAALDGVSGLLLPLSLPFGTLGFGINPSVDALAFDAAGATVYLAGTFYQLGGVSRLGLAAVNLGSVVQPWAPTVTGSVNALLPVGPGVLLGGAFTTVNATAIANLGFVDGVLGAVDPTWSSGADGEVRALAASGSTVWVGGAFTTVAGQPRSTLASFDAAMGSLTSFTAPVFTASASGGGPVIAQLAATAQNLYIVGDFETVGGLDRRKAVSLDQATGQVSAWNPRPLVPLVSSGTIEWFSGLVSMGVGTLAILGETLGVAAEPRDRLAAYDLDTRTLASWSAGPIDSTVTGLAFAGDSIFLRGSFNQIQGQGRSRLAAVNRATGLLLPWDPGIAPGNAGVDAMVTTGSTVWIAGSFTTVGAQARSGLALVDSVLGMTLPVDPAPVGAVAVLELEGGLLYVGGAFTALGGQLRAGLGAIDPATGVLTAFAPALDAEVTALAGDAGTLFVGGLFLQADGQARQRAAAYDLATGQLLPFAPALPTFTPFGLIVVRGFAFAGSQVYIGGTFANVGPGLAAHLVEVDRILGLPTPFAATTPPVLDLTVVGSRLLTGVYTPAPVAGSEFIGYPITQVATVVDVAPACSNSPTGPLLTVTPAVLGTTHTYTLSQSPALALGGLFVSFVPPPGPSAPVAGCALALDLPSLASLATFITDAGGGFTLPIALPVLPGLVGVTVRGAAVVAAPGGALGGAWQLSNAVELVLGF